MELVSERMQIVAVERHELEIKQLRAQIKQLDESLERLWAVAREVVTERAEPKPKKPNGKQQQTT